MHDELARFALGVGDGEGCDGRTTTVKTGCALGMKGAERVGTELASLERTDDVA